MSIYCMLFVTKNFGSSNANYFMCVRAYADFIGGLGVM